MSADPFSPVYIALWQMLEEHKPLAAMVKVGNRIRFAGPDRSPLKAEIQTADLPELRVVPAGGSTLTERTSSSGTCSKRFVIQVATGEQRIDVDLGLYRIEWEVLRAMHGWKTRLAALSWNGHAGYVILCRLAELTEGVQYQEDNRGIKGWIGLWACEVQMAFATADMQPVTT
jgi:hypothetical protein